LQQLLGTAGLGLQDVGAVAGFGMDHHWWLVPVGLLSPSVRAGRVPRVCHHLVQDLLDLSQLLVPTVGLHEELLPLVRPAGGSERGFAYLGEWLGLLLQVLAGAGNHWG
jgi:hypothetical protein